MNKDAYIIRDLNFCVSTIGVINDIINKLDPMHETHRTLFTDDDDDANKYQDLLTQIPGVTLRAIDCLNDERYPSFKEIVNTFDVQIDFVRTVNCEL